MHLDFLDRIGLPVKSPKYVTLLFYKEDNGKKKVYIDKELIIRNERDKIITPNNEGEYRLTPDFFKLEGYIYLEREQKEDVKSKDPNEIKIPEPKPIRIKQLQYKMDPPQIIIHLD